MLLVITATILIVLDQLVKYYVQSLMQVGMSIPMIPDAFHITYILNPGAAFGILKNYQFVFVLAAIALIIAVGFIYPKIQPKIPLMIGGIGLLVGGAIGNLIDRIRIGLVIDYLDFRIWPVFNIADIGICVGVACIVYSLIYLVPKEVKI